MQINRFTQIVTDVTSVGFNLLCCIALLIFYFCLALLLLLLALSECAGEFRSCGSDEDAVPRPCKPLKRLDRNFYMGCALCCDRGGLQSPDYSKLYAAAPQKK